MLGYKVLLPENKIQIIVCDSRYRNISKCIHLFGSKCIHFFGIVDVNVMWNFFFLKKKKKQLRVLVIETDVLPFPFGCVIFY